jgi:hypothetical protein
MHLGRFSLDILADKYVVESVQRVNKGKVAMKEGRCGCGEW